MLVEGTSICGWVSKKTQTHLADCQPEEYVTIVVMTMMICEKRWSYLVCGHVAVINPATSFEAH